jgi:hypothetical protein
MNTNQLKSSLLLAASLIASLSASSQDILSGRQTTIRDIKATTAGIVDNAKRVESATPLATSGPVDPTNPSKPLFCNEKVQREFREAFMKTRNGEARGGLAEAGRSIELNNGEIAFGSWATTESDNGDENERANRMQISRGDSTIAFFHTHGNNARPVPSARDLQGDVPDFVISRFSVYVTIPGTDTYVHLNPSACK